MPFSEYTGKIKSLRTNDIGHVWGPPDDTINTEVVVVLDSDPDSGFGFYLRPGDDNLPSRQEMISTLRYAFLNNLTIGIECDVPDGKKNGILRRVELSR